MLFLNLLMRFHLKMCSLQKLKFVNSRINQFHNGILDVSQRARSRKFQAPDGFPEAHKEHQGLFGVVKDLIRLYRAYQLAAIPLISFYI